MIIRTITCHHAYNHGAMLQAYALVNYLQSLGHDVRVIDYRPSYMPEHVVDFKYVPRQYDFLGFRSLYLLIKKKDYILEQKRRDAFEIFFNKNIPVTKEKYNGIEDLRKLPPKADLYIAGSDQIWNTCFPNGKDPSFYLDFGNAKKISYAASFATESISDQWQGFVKKQLNNLNRITVREPSALSLLNSLGYEGDVVMDPVFLLNKEQWDEFDNGISATENYVLTYDYVKRNSIIGFVAKRIAKMHNCKVYSIGPYSLSYSDKSFVEYGPDTFLSLIKNAKCVISNSFHASAFSMIFNKNFFVVNRNDGLNIRMKDLLCKYGIPDRLITRNVSDEMLNKEICYNNLNSIIMKDINSSKQIIKDLLNV